MAFAVDRITLYTALKQTMLVGWINDKLIRCFMTRWRDDAEKHLEDNAYPCQDWDIV